MYWSHQIRALNEDVNLLTDVEWCLRTIQLKNNLQDPGVHALGAVAGQ